MTNPTRATGDAIVLAVAKMASYEAMYGQVPTYQAHMRGLKRMIELRGGFSVLGLDGLLQRMIIWIDINSAFINNISRQFPDQHFTAETPVIEPNPGNFIGNSR
jgi:hypothetical protein